MVYAIYALCMMVVYVVGFPALLLYVLVKRRATLFGEGSTATQRDYGFLYYSYGPNAWFWEVEELIRKLVLSAVVVSVVHRVLVHCVCVLRPVRLLPAR